MIDINCDPMLLFPSLDSKVVFLSVQFVQDKKCYILKCILIVKEKTISITSQFNIKINSFSVQLIQQHFHYTSEHKSIQSTKYQKALATIFGKTGNYSVNQIYINVYLLIVILFATQMFCNTSHCNIYFSTETLQSIVNLSHMFKCIT